MARERLSMRKIKEILRLKSLGLMLLWEKYLANNTGGYRYTQFCHHYRMWRRHISPSMRQVHRAGEKMFVDFAGHTVPVVDRLSGEIKDAQVFVAVLGASNYTYCQAVWSQDLPNWIDCHTQAFKFFGGVTKLVIPDNLKAGVSKPCRYEPNLNPTYRDMADHFGIVVIYPC